MENIGHKTKKEEEKMATAYKYNQEKIKESLANRNRKLATGLYKVRCIAAAVKAPKEPNYNLGAELAWALVKDDGETSNVKVRHWVTWPIENPEVKDHTQPDTYNMVAPFVQAVFPEECPLYPRRDPKTKKMMYQGEEIEGTKESIEEAEGDAKDKIMAFICESGIVDDPSVLEGKEVYAKVYYQKDKDTGTLSDFPSLGSWQTELREGQTTQPQDQWFAAAGATPAGEKKNGTNGAHKPNGKPAVGGTKKPSFGKKK